VFKKSRRRFFVLRSLQCAKNGQFQRHNIAILHSFILETYIAPLQDTTTQRRNVDFKRQSTQMYRINRCISHKY